MRGISTRRFFTEVGDAVTKGNIPALAGRKFAAAVTLWPSKKFTDSELIPGGGAASLSKDEMKVVKARLKDFTKDFVRLGKAKPANAATKKKVERATALLPKLETDPKAQEQFVKIVRSLLSDKAAEKDDGTKEFFKTKDAQLLQNLRKEAVVVAPAGRGGAAALGVGAAPGALTGGGAAGLFSDLGDSIMSGARRLLNFTTYYQMKERAGIVGEKGLAPLLTDASQGCSETEDSSRGTQLRWQARHCSHEHDDRGDPPRHAHTAAGGVLPQRAGVEVRREDGWLLPQDHDRREGERADPHHAYEERQGGGHRLSARVTHQRREDRGAGR